MTDVMCLFYELTLRNGIKDQLCEKKKTLKDMVKKFYVIKKFEFEPLKVLHLKAPAWVTQFLYVSFVRDKQCFLLNFFFESVVCVCVCF
jgi:hypothetical protein